VRTQCTVVACWPRLPYTRTRLVVFNSSDSPERSRWSMKEFSDPSSEVYQTLGHGNRARNKHKAGYTSV